MYVLSLNVVFSSVLTPGVVALETEISCVLSDADSSVNITSRSGEN